MRATIASLILMLTAGATQGQELKKGEPLRPPGAQMQTDFSYFAYWCLYPRSFAQETFEQKLADGRVLHLVKVTYVLEFTSDIAFLHLEPLQRDLLRTNKKLRHNFYDQENVAINGNRFLDYTIQGEVSGRAGEAFRVIVEFVDDPRASVLNSKKLIVRAQIPDLPVNVR